MSIALRAVGARAAYAPGSPAGSANNDCIVLAVDANVITSGNNPGAAGFNFLGFGGAAGLTGRGIALFIKKSTGSEPSTYTITNPTGGSVSMSEAYGFTGVDVSGAMATVGTIVGATSASPTTTTPDVSVTDAAGDLRLLFAITNGGALTVASAASGFAEISPTAASILHTLSKVSPGGASGPLNVVFSGASNPRAGGVISLIADTGGGGTPPPVGTLALRSKLADGSVVTPTVRYKLPDGSIVTPTLARKDQAGTVTV